MAGKNLSPIIDSSYPSGWERKECLTNDMKILIRPILPEDALLYEGFMKKNNFDDIRHRFFGSMKELSHDLVSQLTQVDYDNTMAFVALDELNGDLLGISRYARDNDSRHAEYTVMTRSDLKAHGIGFSLTSILIEYAKLKMIDEIWVQIMRDNYEMIEMCKDLHFIITADETDSFCVIAKLSLS